MWFTLQCILGRRDWRNNWIGQRQWSHTVDMCLRANKITWRKSKNVSGIRRSMYAVSLENRFRTRPEWGNQQTMKKRNTFTQHKTQLSTCNLRHKTQLTTLTSIQRLENKIQKLNILKAYANHTLRINLSRVVRHLINMCYNVAGLFKHFWNSRLCYKDID